MYELLFKNVYFASVKRLHFINFLFEVCFKIKNNFISKCMDVSLEIFSLS